MFRHLQTPSGPVLAPSPAAGKVNCIEISASLRHALHDTGVTNQAVMTIKNYDSIIHNDNGRDAEQLYGKVTSLDRILDEVVLVLSSQLVAS